MQERKNTCSSIMLKIYEMEAERNHEREMTRIKAYNPMSTPRRPGFEDNACSVNGWSVERTCKFLDSNCFNSYADHFRKKGYNGAVLAAVEVEDIKKMPETDALKQKAFLKLIQSLQ